MDRSEWDPRSLDNYDEKGNLKEVLMLNPAFEPEERFTKEGEPYYYTRRNKETGAIEPITSSNPLELLRLIPQVNQVWSHFDKKDSTKWTPKDLAFPLNVPYGGRREGNLSDWSFTSWFFNQAPTQLAPLVAKGRPQTQHIVMKGKYEQTVKIPLTSKGARDAALLSKSLNQGNQGQLSGTNVKGDIKPGIVYNKQGLPVNPGFDTGYRSFIQRGRDVENLPVVRGERSVSPIVAQLNTQPSKVGKGYTLTTKRDYIAESGMNVEEGLDWLRVGQPDMLKKLLTTGAGKKKVLNTIEQLEQQYAVNKTPTLKAKIDYAKSMVATGPAMDPYDKLLYGPSTKDFIGNPDAITANLKGFVDGWKPQDHKAKHGHHFHMKSLQYHIFKRLFDLKQKGIVTEGDILNTHAMLWPSGMTSGSRRSSIMSVDGVPHISAHKLELQTEGLFDTGPVEPKSTPWSKAILTKKPNDVKASDWKLIQAAGIEVNRFDIDYIKNWAGKTDNIEFGIQKLKELKSKPELYDLYGPDGKSEIQRIQEQISNANSAAEIQAIQQDLAENVTGPMTESMQWLQDYAEHIGGVELMKYTKDLPGFYKAASEWYLRKLDLEEFKREEKWRQMNPG